MLSCNDDIFLHHIKIFVIVKQISLAATHGKSTDVIQSYYFSYENNIICRQIIYLYIVI